MLENLWNCLHYIFNFHVVQIYVSLLLLVRGRQFRQGWRGVAQDSDLGEDVFGARSAERGARIAEGGGRMSAERGRTSAECGVRPAGVYGAGWCLQSQPMSAECGVRSANCGVHVDRAECGPQTAGPADIRGARTAEYCGLMRTTEFCCLIRQAVLFRQATGGVAQVSDPADTECSGASQTRSAECGTQQRLKNY